MFWGSLNEKGKYQNKQCMSNIILKKYIDYLTYSSIMIILLTPYAVLPLFTTRVSACSGEFKFLS